MMRTRRSHQIANPTYSPVPYSPLGYRSFREFYPFYLGEHSNSTCRRLHFVGTSISVACQLRLVLSFLPSLLLHLNQDELSGKLVSLRLVGGRNARIKLAILGTLQAYAWAWVGHFIFEGNRPATFKHPFYSLWGDLTLWKEAILFQRSI
ncbi:hypothetical protein FRB95_001630 [Tulasnella sp. JGI-2019a]|nr:hypothetical protein FRB95_001630 [Tulasnella sp. JGI-2019a]